MAKPKKCRRRKVERATTQDLHPRGAVEHAAELARDFAQIFDQAGGSNNRSDTMPKAIRKKMKQGIKSVVATGLSKGVGPDFSSDKNKTTFESRIFNMVYNIFSSMIPLDMFDALHQSFRRLVPKIQALEVTPEALLSAQAARLSIDYEVADRMDDKVSDDEKQTTKQVAQPATRLQGSVDLSPDRSDDKSDSEGDEESGNNSEIGVKQENEEDGAALVPPDPTVFTITLALPISPDDHRFKIRFNNERVVDGLRCMPSREIWQLVHDAIQHDPDIPNYTSSLSRITEVYQQDDGSLAFRMRTKEDLDTLCANVQWARDFRDTISAGIKTYRVMFQFINSRTMKLENHTDRAWIIEKIGRRNSKHIPSLNHIGAIRDIKILQYAPSEGENRGDIDYLLVFGSREAANAALKMGLRLLDFHRACLVYEPGTQWHQQCSRCQGQSHTAKDCQSELLCGKCGYKHATRYCTSTTFKCANCHGNHTASSKECPKWLEAEAKAHQCYRFPTENPEPQTPTQSILATAIPPPPISPQPSPQDLRKKIPKTKPSTAAPIPTPKTLSIYPPTPPPQPSNPRPKNFDVPEPAPPSALLQTIDEFRAFVAAREHTHNNHGSKKRKESEHVMTGALQTESNEYEHDGRGKRVKREEEGPVWPIGQSGYMPPSLSGVV